MGADKWLGIQSWGQEGESDRERAGEAGGKRKTETEAREDGEREGRGVGDSKKHSKSRASRRQHQWHLGAVLSIPGR